ncbi:substrate-binding domain-containing protein [Spongiimicrobium sp. 3-5]|uniref:substrate-binding domain-containing protein n=1 Tax=Spongiimicrobium sp. 3-5 TaxID=3332596 RepID=UPI003980D296
MKTIKDIAEEAQVSTGTIDRVLHNRGGVSKKTEEKVKRILKKNDFKINAIGRSLALNKTIKIATLIPEFDSENVFWKAPLQGINKAQEEVGIFGVAVQNFPFDQFMISSYQKQFEALLATEPDGVVIVPTFQMETRQIVSELEEKGIPYIFFNIDLEGFNNISFIGQDSYMSGYLAGKLMCLCINPRASVLIIQTRANIDNNHSFSKRIAGFADYFSENKLDINCIKANIINLNNANEVMEKLRSILTKNPSIKGIFVPSSRVSIFAKALQQMDKNGLSLIGFDGTEQNVNHLKAGEVAFLISQKPYEQGYNAIKVMTGYLTEKKLPASKIYSPMEILTKENVSYT